MLAIGTKYGEAVSRLTSIFAPRKLEIWDTLLDEHGLLILPCLTPTSRTALRDIPLIPFVGLCS